MPSKILQSVKKRGVVQSARIAVEMANPWSARSVKAKRRKLALTSLRKGAQGDGCVTKRIHGSLMRLDVSPGTKHTLETDLAIEETREPASTDFFREKLRALKFAWEQANRPSPLILDIGANVGYFVLLEALIFEGKAAILAVEPELENCERLQQNIDLNEYSNVKVIRAAASDKGGRACLHVGDQSNIHKLALEGHDPHFQETQQVDLVVIDELVKTHSTDATPVIVRMDVEGHEWLAIKGMATTLCSNRPVYFFFELHRSALAWAPEIAATLRKANFEIERIDSSKGWETASSVAPFEAIASMTTDAHIFAKRGC